MTHGRKANQTLKTGAGQPLIHLPSPPTNNMNTIPLLYLLLNNALYDYIYISIFILQYHIHQLILFPIAHLFNTLYIIWHPNHPLLTIISPSYSNILHSFVINEHTLQSINIPRAEAGDDHIWSNPQQLAQHMFIEGQAYFPTIILDGILSSPPLCQGIILALLSGYIYIGKELGHWPSHNNLILTYSVNIHTLNLFYLLIPVHLFDKNSIDNHSTPSSLNHPISLSDFLHTTPSEEACPCWHSINVSVIS